MQTPLHDARSLSIKALKRRRIYNALVVNEAIEDYSLRSAAKSFRRWPCWLLANTALGGITFMALEAIGALLVLNNGFVNSTLAILCVSAIIILTGLPISYYASRYNVDIDLLTRGAGFGYYGSTVTSLIYASYTIIFFAIEAAIMAKALSVGLGIPIHLGYLISSVVIIPLVFYGITFINKLQLYTQPVWVVLTVILFAYILTCDPTALDAWVEYTGKDGMAAGFDPLLFGGALSVLFSLVPQIGEQVDYLRFLPDKTPENKGAWWLSMAAAGPGWIVVGCLKLLGGSFLAVYFMQKAGARISDALDPVNLYYNGFSALLGTGGLTLATTTIFVIVCQVKINVTNAYAGSLAWSNFFSRISHSHPGRALWLVFNVTISLLLMQFGVFYLLHSVLMVYAMFAVSWVGALFADLVILKPLGLSPRHIEYKRANLYNLNPVGFGAMLMASGVSLLCYRGAFGPLPQAFAPLVALVVSVPTAVGIALLTGGKYYMARKAEPVSLTASTTCTTCGNSYEAGDMVYCPAYDEPVCSLCCSLDSVCGGFCKRLAHATAGRKEAWDEAKIPLPFLHLSRRAKIFCLHFFNIFCAQALIFVLCYAYFRNTGLGSPLLEEICATIFVFSSLINGIWVWWSSLIQETRLRTEDELDRHIHELNEEVKRREAMSAQLAESASQQRLILENASIGIAYVREKRVVWGNNRFMRLCGLADDLRQGATMPLGTILAKLGTGTDIMNEVRAAHVSGGKFDVELPIFHSSTQQYWCVLSVSVVDPVHVEYGSIWLLDDITERKLAEEKLRQSEERLKELNESLESQVRLRTEELERSFESVRQADKMASLGILVAGVAHEINNPSSFIRMNIGLLQSIWDDSIHILDRESKKEDLWIAGMPFDYARKSIPKLLRGIHQGAERVSTIICNLKDYARQVPLDMSGSVDLNKAVHSALELLTTPLRKATNRLVVETEDGLPAFRGDQRRIEQILVNLIQNAYQALQNRRQGIHMRTYRADGTVCFEIVDEGHGITQEQLTHICDPFYTTKRDQGGTGLGLSVSAGIIKEHGGNMQFSSEPGRGTTVTLRFQAPERPPLQQQEPLP